MEQEIVELGDQLAQLKPEKAQLLVDYLKQTYNIEPLGSLKIDIPPPPPPLPPDEKKDFAVVLESYDAAKKIPLVKAYRELTACALKEAMDFVNGLPKVIKEGLPKVEADKLKVMFEEFGGKVRLQ